MNLTAPSFQGNRVFPLEGKMRGSSGTHNVKKKEADVLADNRKGNQVSSAPR